MSLEFQISLYEERKANLHSRLAKKKIYSEKVGINPKYAELQKQELNDIENYLNEADAIIYQLVELYNEQYSKGYHNGFKEGKQSAIGDIPNKAFEKEKFRAYWEMEKKEQWKDLW